MGVPFAVLKTDPRAENGPNLVTVVGLMQIANRLGNIRVERRVQAIRVAELPRQLRPVKWAETQHADLLEVHRTVYLVGKKFDG